MSRPFLPRLSRGTFFFVLFVGMLPAICGAAPYVPTDDAVIIEQLPRDAHGDTLRRLAARRATVAERDPTVAVALARRYIERSRAQADPRLLGYAEGLLTPWLARPDVPPEVLLLGATLHQARHQFDSALRDLDIVLSRRPDDAQAWLTRATILRVQGLYPQALQACERLHAVAPGFASELCALSLRGLSRDPMESIADMRSLRLRAGTQSSDLQDWCDAESAELFERTGMPEAALEVYTQALRRNPSEPGLRAAFADLLLDLGRAPEAMRATEGWVRVDALRLRRALAMARTGLPVGSEIDALASGFEAARRRGEDLHLREASRFELALRGDARRALAFAQRNWQVQREPWDARLLIESAVAAGRPDAARPVREWMARSGLRDARLPPG